MGRHEKRFESPLVSETQCLTQTGQSDNNANLFYRLLFEFLRGAFQAVPNI